MKKIFIFIMFLILGIVGVNGADYDITQDMHFTTADEIPALREVFINWVWKNGTPDYEPEVVSNIVNNHKYYTMTDTSNLERIDKLVITTPRGFIAYNFLFVPKIKNNRLFILSYGHEGNTVGMKELAQSLINEGYYVIIRNMPMIPVESIGNKCPTGMSCKGHYELANLNTPTYNPYEEFLNDIWVSITYMEETYKILDISIGGISGGGWTSIVYASIDTRIDRSYDIAGNLPLFLFDKASYTGDYEQGRIDQDIRNFYLNQVSYLDMYAMASYNREHYQMFNLYDNCCFYGWGFTQYNNTMAEFVKDLGGGVYQTFVDENSHSHQVTLLARNFILNKNSQVFNQNINKTSFKVKFQIENNNKEIIISRNKEKFISLNSIISYMNILWGGNLKNGA